MIPENTKEQILSASRIQDVITDLVKAGSSFRTKCPSCGADGKGKGLQVNLSKQIYKCFNCDFKGNSAVSYLIEAKKLSYPEALKFLADRHNISIEETPKKRGPQRKEKPEIETFRDKQLKSSGITEADQKATIKESDREKIVDLFQSGTRDQYGKLSSGDDMIIWYYDLEGRPIMYQPPKSTKTVQLFRVRWQNPDLHKDKNGRPMKYSSPYGSGSHLFIPDQIRAMYRDRRVLKRLYIQEGEKKAVKACIHGIPSVGVMGIQNIGQDGKLPYDLQLIVQVCQVEEIVFVLDSDWDHLSSELKVGDKVDKRPLSFYYAVRNYRDYFKTFVNMGIYLDIYFAHVKENDHNDKGLDDLLSGLLAGQENKLLEDINSAINEKNGSGQYIQIYNISTVSDLKLLEYWCLNNAESFAKKYRDDLINLPEFIIGKHKWRFNAQGAIEPAQPLMEDEQYWEIREGSDRAGNPIKSVQFQYLYAYTFLKRRGFGRITMANKQYQFARIDNKIVEILDHWKIKDFIIDFTKEIVDKDNRVPVMDMLFRGGAKYFGPDSLGNMEFIYPKFETSDKSYQMLFFKDKYWMINADGITEHGLNDLKYNVWKDKINDFEAQLLPDNFIKVLKLDQSTLADDERILDGQFEVEMSDQAENCHFAKFLYNTGDFFWRNYIDPNGWKALPHDTRTAVEIAETNLHFLSKMTAIGYLLHKYRDKSCEKAVVPMDGKVGEIGESNGRTGKSLLGKALENVVPTVIIGGKSKNLTEDPFIWEEVTEKTDLVVLDDVRTGFDFEFLFPLITGQLTVNSKGSKKYTLPESSTPKIMVNTNHAINGDGPSFRDRQHMIAFSDYYNDYHKPMHDFGINFFNEWDNNQWNLFYNFMGRCLHIYFMAQRMGWGVNGSGLIQAPLERLERRRLRQYIGEVFLTWADEYFGTADDIDSDDVKSSNINNRIPRTEIYNEFLEKNPVERKFVNPFKFKKKLIAFCNFRKLQFNPTKELIEGRPGDDKSGGIEYFTVANSHFSS